jgi:hypothetical protein
MLKNTKKNDYSLISKKELLKCILLCKNCHYEAHNQIPIIEGNEGQ